jgi:hypothetical protein
MEQERQGSPTPVDEVQLPVEFVTLAHLKTLSGKAVVVQVESRDELVIQRALGGALPGAREAVKRAEGAEELTPDEVTELTAFTEPLLEECCSLVSADGTEVRPAFWFDPARPRHPRSIPGRLLRLEDRTALIEASLRVCGYSGGAAESATFPSGKRKGRRGGKGAVEAREGNGGAPEHADGATAAEPGGAGVRRDGGAGVRQGEGYPVEPRDAGGEDE